MNFAKWKHYLRARLFHMLNMDNAALQEYQLSLKVAPDFTRAASCIAFIYASHAIILQRQQIFVKRCALRRMMRRCISIWVIHAIKTVQAMRR